MATYGRLVLPNADPALTNAGLLDVGATLTFFVTGTDTLATIYSDPTGMTPIANPLTSDAAGRFYDDSTQWCADISQAYDANLVLTTGTTFFYSALYAVGAAIDTSGFLENPNVALTGIPTAPTATAGDSSSQIATTAFVTQAIGISQVAEFRNQQTNGTISGETLTNGAQTQRILNTTVVNTISGCSLTANQVTLPAGKYLAWGWAQVESSMADGVNAKSRVRDTTNNVTLVLGGMVGAPDNLSFSVTPFSGAFTLSGSTVVEVDTYAALISGNATGGGPNSLAPELENYVDVTFQKIG